MIQALVCDSRRVAPGVAFFAYPGESADGRRFIPEAVARGAAAVVWEFEGYAWDPAWAVPNIAVPGLRQAAGQLANEFYGRPSAAYWVCGVTGTNGKTSCSQWIAAAFAAHGLRAGVIGTLGAGLAGHPITAGHAMRAAGNIRPLSARSTGAPATNTTPDALRLHGLLAEFRAAGVNAVAMEVSSHALMQGRVNGVAFDCALFTNLSHEHLDYHGTMEAYAAAKARLFDCESLGRAVLNLDDVLGVELARRSAARGLPTTGYSLSPAAVAPGGVTDFIAARELRADAQGMTLVLTTSWGEREARLFQLGRFNVANLLGVLGCLLDYGLDIDAALACIAQLPEVPGRMQRLGGVGKPLVVIDYAHTPDALDKVLQALRPLADAAGGRLIAVFGAGGDRDASKRPLMGEVASRFADRIVLTSDNPRSEDPQAIVDAIRAGVSIAHDVELDRARALAGAICEARAADVVLIAGKGHEDYQEIAGRRLPFSDAALAEQILSTWGRA